MGLIWACRIQLACILAFFQFVHAQDFVYSLGHVDDSTLNGASEACVAAFQANVSCPSSLGAMYGDMDTDLDPTDLKELCEGGCLASLKKLRDSVAAQCDSKVTYEDPTDGTKWKATYLVDAAIYGYDRACLKKGNGQYCNTWFQSASDDATVCEECFKLLLWQDAVSPLELDLTDSKAIYTSASSSCSYKTQPTVTYAPLLVSAPAESLACSSKYTIKAGDTYLGVSKAQKVSTHDLITANQLDYSLKTFPASGTLCIRNQCNTYVVKDGDTCDTIQSTNSISRSVLRAWNPYINGYCDNISSFVNQTICVSNPLGDFNLIENKDQVGYQTPAPVPTNIAPDTTKNCGLFHDVIAGDDCGTIGLKYSISLPDLRFLNPMIWQNCTNLWLKTSYCVAPVGDIAQYPGYGPPTSTISIEPAGMTELPYTDPWTKVGANIPIANGTREDCWEYLWWNSTKSGPPMSCRDAIIAYGIKMDQFFQWNPSLDQTKPDTDPTYDFPCALSASVSYCVQLASEVAAPAQTAAPPSPRAAGEIANCTNWFMGYFDCESQLSLLQMSIDQLYKYNPSIKADCTGYNLGTWYCYETVDDLEGGDTSVPPVVSTPTTSAPPTTVSSGNGVKTPTPTQSGMVANCNKFHQAVNGDGCWAISNTYGIALADFYKWNPGVGNDCQTLMPTYYVCVGIISSATSKAATTTTAKPATTTAKPTTTAKTTSTAPPKPSNVSTNGVCGSANGKTCLNSGFGDCCSSSGYCGSNTDYCGGGCQSQWGKCNAGSDKISPDGTCGGTKGYTCTGSQFGKCCSQYGYCGNDAANCGTGCQKSFGTCT